MTHHHTLSSSGRHFIAYLADNINAVGDLASDTARSLWDGLNEEAVNRDCDLLAVVGGGYCKGFGSLVYDLITPESADGFVVWIVEEGLRVADYIARFDSSHLVSLSRSYSQHPVVAIANKAGIRSLLQHLVLQHGRSRIGFIRGPEHHPYAQERFEAYCETLAEIGITLDERLIAPAGEWDWQTGVNGIRYLLDEQQLVIGRDLDAVMCVSDRIAMGAFDELDRRNIRVPEQLALTGFNNLLEAQSHTPSMTTVAVPFQRKSRLALRMILAAMHGKRYEVDPDYLDPVVIIGESCGCANPHVLDLPLLPGLQTEDEAFSAKEIERYSEALRTRFRAFRAASSTLRQSAAFLVKAFVEAVEAGKHEEFIDFLSGQIRAGHYAFMDLMHWQDVLTLLRRMLCEHPRNLHDTFATEAMLDKARLAVADRFARGQSEFRLHELRQASLLRQFGSKLGFSSDVPTIMDILARDIASLGIPSCWVSVFEGVGDLATQRAPQYSRLLLALDGGRRSAMPDDDGILFPSRQLIPEGFVKAGQRRTFILFPLAHGEDEYGFVIFEQGPNDGSVYETLAFNIGGALKSAFLRQELEKRTLELELSIYELGRTRNKLVESEKLAALGELVAGVAHEINTPIGIGVTAVSTMAESVKRLRTALQERNGRVLRQEVDTLAEGADIALRNMYRANELIESFKQIAVDQSYEELRTFELGGYLQAIVRSLEPRLRPLRHVVTIDCPAPIRMNSYPGALAQVVSNLIMNSIIHGFESRQGGSITMTCRLIDGMAEIKYCDDGLGMPPSVLEKIFHPFFTTKRGQGGTGLGMHIAYNLITQLLAGNIECESEPDGGVCFLLRLSQEANGSAEKTNPAA